MTVFSKLVPTVISAYILQTACALTFVPQANEKFYDLSGAIGFLTTTFVSLYYPTLKARFWDGIPMSFPPITSFAPRQLLVSAALGVWSVRLGSFLAMRAIKAGGDSRFDRIKHDPKKFTYYWMAQATWICLVGLPVYLTNALPAALHPPLGPRDYASVGLIAGSLMLEVLADRQKSAWRHRKDNKLHDEKFITRGLWSVSRHPNYVGEVGIWTGVWALSTASLQTAHYPIGSVVLAVASPVFTYLLTRYASGVPPLERAGDKKFGDDPKWQEYKRTVPIFFPWGGVQ
ncbi:hypothetical protein SERLA73DRAFT_181316 [Serpula lacrymans var. lacrymans S7.3]|uniref:Steroid 5-alpha reductase C-terminal domain-containing protein n=2 Tax=Serpula lacrymans var. lacrymans TaxID=341189 RepID=F8PXU9_SERL3|nr:uncharacterized protein SERLADRAFT_467410 [Serpula lacrymans var. lacrymans S7.9]EGN98712.1 hypothetical protein SERLA73DRAFT_181316 [Serpula lacrymans var. lacrymans S7.3]EGO24315.1 hypothetical protein SERLADRAFT_467410 [Serpula lacrymans var. lacrymans S7.9]